MISDAVLTPGKTGRSSSWQRRTTAALRPGETTKRAPASWARSTWVAVMTVPAPTSSSDRSASRRSTAAASGVRNVASATGRPPATSARSELVRLAGVIEHDHRNDAVTSEHAGRGGRHHRSSAITVFSSV